MGGTHGDQREKIRKNTSRSVKSETRAATESSEKTQELPRGTSRPCKASESFNKHCGVGIFNDVNTYVTCNPGGERSYTFSKREKGVSKEEKLSWDLRVPLKGVPTSISDFISNSFPLFVTNT